MTTTTTTVLQTLQTSISDNEQPAVKNCRILLEQRFTAHMPLLTTISTFWIKQKTMEFSSMVLLSVSVP